MADTPNVGSNPDFEVRQLTRTRDLGSTLFDNRGRQYDRLSGASFLNVSDTRTPGGVAQAGIPTPGPARNTSPQTRYTGSGRNWRQGSPTGLAGTAYQPSGKFTSAVANKVGETGGKVVKSLANQVAKNAGYKNVTEAIFGVPEEIDPLPPGTPGIGFRGIASGTKSLGRAGGRVITTGIKNLFP